MKLLSIVRSSLLFNFVQALMQMKITLTENKVAWHEKFTLKKYLYVLLIRNLLQLKEVLHNQICLIRLSEFNKFDAEIKLDFSAGLSV